MSHLFRKLKRFRYFTIKMSVPSSSAASISTAQPISMIGTMGIVQNPQIQTMSILQNQRAQQIAPFQGQARPSPQQLVTGVRPIVNVVGNQSTVATLQNVQVLGKQFFILYKCFNWLVV